MLLTTLFLAPTLAIQVLPIKGRVTIGEPAEISVRVSNPGQSSVMVVPTDPTFADFRSPRCKLEARRVGTYRWLDISMHPTCGNTDPIFLRDFAELPPGKESVWHGPLRWTNPLVNEIVSHPGTYEIRMTYRTDAPIDNWIGGPIPEPQHKARIQEIQSAFNRVPKGVFVSRPMLIEFAKPSGT